MTEKQAIWKSILHWRRMIKWVERQDEKFMKLCPCQLTMVGNINEDWTADYCALCVLYEDPGQPFMIGEESIYIGCYNCPLGKKFGHCEDDPFVNPSHRNAWPRVHHASTWRGWLYHARRLLKQLESLRKPKGKR